MLSKGQGNRSAEKIFCRRGLWMMQGNIWSRSPSLVQIGLQLFKWGHFHIFSLSYNLTSDELWPWYMTFDHMNIWRFPYYINSLNEVWFQSDVNFSNKAIFTFLAFLTTWPQITFDLGMIFDCMNIWRFPYYINIVTQHEQMRRMLANSVLRYEGKFEPRWKFCKFAIFLSDDLW